MHSVFRKNSLDLHAFGQFFYSNTAGSLQNENSVASLFSVHMEQIHVEKQN